MGCIRDLGRFEDLCHKLSNENVGPGFFVPTS